MLIKYFLIHDKYIKQRKLPHNLNRFNNFHLTQGTVSTEIVSKTDTNLLKIGIGTQNPTQKNPTRKTHKKKPTVKNPA